MKTIKYILTIALIMNAFISWGQEKGLYFTAGGSLGANQYRYKLDNGNRSTPQIGFGGNLGLQYFFTRHWGLASGLGITYYNSKGKYANSWDNDPQHYLFTGMYDDDFRYEFGDDYTHYDLRLGLNEWTEVQQGYFFEIPLMLMYQTKWGASQGWGMYAGIGGKVRFPVINQTYSVKRGSELSVAAWYPKPDLVLPDPQGPDVSWHGYGTNADITYKGDMDVKTSFALSGKIGLIKTLSERVDLTLGAYLDYGLNNIKDGNKTPEAFLIHPENNAKTIHPSSYVGDHLQYNGYINSHPIDKVIPVALGGEIGIRIRLGKSKGKVPEEIPVIQDFGPRKSGYTIQVLDSLTRKPLSTQVDIACRTCSSTDKQTIYSSDKNAVNADLFPENTYDAMITKSVFPPYNTQFMTMTGQNEIILVMPLHPQVTGRIKNNKGNPLPDVDIQITDRVSKNYKAQTNAEGNFVIPAVDAGTLYYITASKTGYIPDTLQLFIPADPDSLQPVYHISDILLQPVKKMVLHATVLFDLDKFDLRPDAKREIDGILPMLKENPDIQISVEGHTDARGSAAYNQTLSQRRAESVKDYMISQGISSNRIKATGYGFTHLLNGCKSGVKCSEADHMVNRRVEFIFSEKGAQTK